MATPREVAEWMVKRLETSEDGLLQVKAVAGIEKRFGPEFIYIHELTGEKSIDRRVLYHFRKLTGNNVVWVSKHGGVYWRGAHWRKRCPGDLPGRTQYDV